MTWKSRIAALLLALCCLTAALTGCGKKQTDTAAPIDQPTQTQTAPEPVDDYEPTKGDKMCIRDRSGSAFAVRPCARGRYRGSRRAARRARCASASRGDR